MEKSGYSFAEIGKWDEATAKRKVGYLPDNGRKWEGEHWQIALYVLLICISRIHSVIKSWR